MKRNDRGGKRNDVTLIKEGEHERSDLTPEIILFTHKLTDTKTELIEEMPKRIIEKRSKCCIDNLQTGGILTKALIDTGAEVTCISEDFVNNSKE